MAVSITLPDVGGDVGQWGAELNAALQTIAQYLNTLSPAAVGLGNVPNVDMRKRENHNGTQLASTISNFAAAVQAVVATGVGTLDHTAITDFDIAAKRAVGAAMVAGAGINLAFNNTTGVITVTSTVTGSTVNVTNLSKTIFEGACVVNAQDDTGLTAEEATVIDQLALIAVGAPAGSATTIAIYKRGPSTNWVLSASPVATLTFTVPVSGGAVAHTVVSSTLAIPMQKYDALVARVTAVGTTPAGNITMIAHLNPTATVPTPVGPPTGVTASIAGQADNAVLVSWSAPTVPAGHTPGVYTIVASNGQSTTQTYGTNNKVFTGLPSSPLTFYVYLTTVASGATLAGASSAPSTAVTPTGGALTRLTANELKGADFELFEGASYSYAAGTSVTGSGQTGSALLTASAAGPVTIGTVAHHSVTAGETKTVGGWFKNNSGAAVTVAMWLSFQDAGGAYSGDSPSPLTLISVAAGATYHYQIATLVPGGAATAALACQFIANGTADSVNISGFEWPV